MSTWRDPAAQINFHKAAEAMRQVIAFAQSLPRYTNNHANAEHQIWQHEIRRANTGSRATTSPWAQSSEVLPPSRAITDRRSQTLSPTPLPPPGVSAYHPPMLHKAPPHLKFESPHSGTTPAAVPSTPPVAEVDSCCRVATPIRVTIPVDASTQAEFPSLGEEAVGPDMEIPQENPQKIEKISENSEEIPKNSQSTSYGDISDSILHALALALPWDREREINLAKLIYLDDWEKYSRWEGLAPIQRLYFHLLFVIMNPWRSNPIDQLHLHSPLFNLFVHWHCQWNGLQESKQESVFGRYQYLTRAQFLREEDFPVGGFYLDQFEG